MNDIIIVRGGGDLATGVIQKLFRAGYKVLVLEVERPTAIRRTVALSEAVYAGKCKVEDVTCVKVEGFTQAKDCWEKGEVPLLVDEKGDSIFTIKPSAVVDAILAKKNLGTTLAMAPVVIGLGPGFYAGKDVHGVIETMRGHDLGRLLLQGSAMANTGIPGEIGGKSAQRVLHAPCSGTVKNNKKIGDIVEKGEVVLQIGECKLTAPFSGLIRGLIREDIDVHKGMKIGDIDPRIDVDYTTISDKARCLGGAVLEAYLYFTQNLEKEKK